MRAMILAAGLGTRMAPVSERRAKPTLPVAGDPLIRRILRWLSRQQVRNLVLNLHHRPETVTAVVGDGTDLDVRVRYSWEPRLLGSAGGPRRALGLVDAPRFWIVNGDSLHALPLAPMADAHAAHGALVTMAVVPGQVLPGVPVWILGEDSRFPGIPFVIFPGNVGQADSLARVIEILREK